MTTMHKPLRREVIANGKVHIATLAQSGVTLREKGKRTTYGPVSWDRIWWDGVQLAAEENLRERRARRGR